MGEEPPSKEVKLKDDIKELLQEMVEDAGSYEDFAQGLADAIEKFVKACEVTVAIGIEVQVNTGTGTGATSSTGTGTIS
ncbi:MAG: hypothetical protein ACOXZ9_10715 [Bacteroidales bacterium]|jgi:hypothetical protein